VETGFHVEILDGDPDGVAKIMLNGELDVWGLVVVKT